MSLSTVDAFKHLNADLRRLQLVLVGIVADIDVVCRGNGLNYMLGGGSALGAIRHKGFIPWDDDVDINMPRADYELFIPLFRAQFGERYWIHTPVETPDYGLALCRIRLKGTSVKTREDLANGQTECGAFVDIFVVENVPANRILRVFHGLGSLGFGFLYSCRKFFYERRFVCRWAGENAKLSGVFRMKLAIGFFIAFLSIDFWTRLWDWWNRLCRDDRSQYVTVPVGRRHYFGEFTRRVGFCETVDAEWEGLTVRTSKDLDGYMRRLYGSDYMTPPPLENREKHFLFAPFVLPGQSGTKEGET